MSCPAGAKRVVKKFHAHSQREGAGFIVRRPIGGSSLSDQEADPFLLLDELPRTNYAPGEFPGAPWHPHRGFDTVMYMKEGRGDHEDSMGNKGSLTDGDCQWMTAGAGILHNEGTNHPGGYLHGFQCWINLPKEKKMTPPAYQDIRSSSIPVVTCNDKVKAKVIAGSCAGQDAVCQTIIPVQYIDFMVQPGGEFTHDVPAEMETVIFYVYKGSAMLGPEQVVAKEGDTCLLDPRGGTKVWFKESQNEELGFLLLAGKPIREPISRYGPFVMNTKEEIRQAFLDYQSGQLCKIKGTMRKI
mmetsp:Transcript_51095/g.159668  ORF Transcript_51095/g.159668 Transcript_51095/m.159668 type:complete len:299 (+) Transcript_51095:57-953(+)